MKQPCTCNVPITQVTHSLPPSITIFFAWSMSSPKCPWQGLGDRKKHLLNLDGVIRGFCMAEISYSQLPSSLQWGHPRWLLDLSVQGFPEFIPEFQREKRDHWPKIFQCNKNYYQITWCFMAEQEFLWSSSSPRVATEQCPAPQRAVVGAAVGQWPQHSPVSTHTSATLPPYITTPEWNSIAE